MGLTIKTYAIEKILGWTAAVFIFGVVFGSLTNPRMTDIFADLSMFLLAFMAVIFIISEPIRLIHFLFFISLYVIIFIGFVVIICRPTPPQFLPLVRYTLPMLIAFALVACRIPSPKTYYYLTVGCIYSIFLWSLFQPEIVFDSQYMAGFDMVRTRVAPFFEGSPHSSGYKIGALVSIVLVFLLTDSVRGLRRILGLGACAAALYLIWGYRSVQAIVTTGTFLVVLLIIGQSISLKRKLFLVVIGLAALTFTLGDKYIYNVQLEGGAITTEELGSGRVGTWIGRLHDIATRDVLTLAIGEGPGSDLKIGAVWPTPLNAHNTYITYAYEYGLVGLFAFLLIWGCIAARGTEATALIVTVCVSGMVSNGITMRPSVFVFFAAAASAWGTVGRLLGGSRHIQGRYLQDTDQTHRGQLLTEESN